MRIAIALATLAIGAAAAIYTSIATREMWSILVAILLCGSVIILGGFALQSYRAAPRRRRAPLPRDPGFPRKLVDGDPYRE